MTIMAPAQATAQTGSSLEIHNVSGFSIYYLFMSSASDDSWKRDLLGRRVLMSGGQFTVTDIPPGRYDLKLVDEDGDTCVVGNFGLYRDSVYRITPDKLIGCEVSTAARR